VSSLLALCALLLTLCCLPFALKSRAAVSEPPAVAGGPSISSRSLTASPLRLTPGLSWLSDWSAHRPQPTAYSLLSTAYSSGARTLSPTTPVAVDQFFAGDGSALDANKWAATSAGPFILPFVVGNVANFATVNGTGNGPAATITFGGITATGNFTISTAS